MTVRAVLVAGGAALGWLVYPPSGRTPYKTQSRAKNERLDKKVFPYVFPYDFPFSLSVGYDHFLLLSVKVLRQKKWKNWFRLLSMLHEKFTFCLRFPP